MGDFPPKERGSVSWLPGGSRLYRRSNFILFTLWKLLIHIIHRCSIFLQPLTTPSIN
uniref:Uncharacterized protein n=1 Tax=Hyaloperonospora arabidopsidis (strain Emoy2) TaxID=559515 RepID=M4BMZ8_HYAAE